MAGLVGSCLRGRERRAQRADARGVRSNWVPEAKLGVETGGGHPPRRIKKFLQGPNQVRPEIDKSCVG